MQRAQLRHPTKKAISNSPRGAVPMRCHAPMPSRGCRALGRGARAQDFDLGGAGGGFTTAQDSYLCQDLCRTLSMRVFQHSGAQDFDLGGEFHYQVITLWCFNTVHCVGRALKSPARPRWTIPRETRHRHWTQVYNSSTIFSSMSTPASVATPSRFLRCAYCGPYTSAMMLSRFISATAAGPSASAST